MLSKALSVYYIFYIHINENMYVFFYIIKDVVYVQQPCSTVTYILTYIHDTLFTGSVTQMLKVVCNSVKG